MARGTVHQHTEHWTVPFPRRLITPLPIPVSSCTDTYPPLHSRFHYLMLFHVALPLSSSGFTSRLFCCILPQTHKNIRKTQKTPVVYYPQSSPPIQSFLPSAFALVVYPTRRVREPSSSTRVLCTSTRRSALPPSPCPFFLIRPAHPPSSHPSACFVLVNGLCVLDSAPVSPTSRRPLLLLAVHVLNWRLLCC